jgi:hypothetical protein
MAASREGRSSVVAGVAELVDGEADEGITDGSREPGSGEETEAKEEAVVWALFDGLDDAEDGLAADGSLLAPTARMRQPIPNPASKATIRMTGMRRLPSKNDEERCGERR